MRLGARSARNPTGLSRRVVNWQQSRLVTLSMNRRTKVDTRAFVLNASLLDTTLCLALHNLLAEICGSLKSVRPLQKVPTMTIEQQVLQVVTGDGEFNEADVRKFVSAAHIDTAGVDYQTVAITGPQSSGKSTLMNALVSHGT